MYNRKKKDKYRTRIEKLFGRKRSRDSSDNSRNRSGSISNIEGSGDTNNPDSSNISSGSGNINNLDGSGDTNNPDGGNISSGSGNINNLDDSDINPKGSSGSNTINPRSGNISPGNRNTNIRISRWTPANTR